MNAKRPVGETRDTGFQVGARRTLDASATHAWELVTSRRGAELWLDDRHPPRFEHGARYLLADGTEGEVRVVGASHLRLTWWPPSWSRASTIQVRVIPSGGRATIAFHQEHLPNAAERERRKEHFLRALDELEKMLG